MTRRRKVWLAVLLVLVVLGGAFLWALPEIVRRQALTRIPALTGRQVKIEDIDLNLFTRRLAVKNLRLAERDPARAFVEFERLEARWSWLSLLAAHIRLTDVRLVAPVIQLVRTGPRDFNFSDLLDLIPPGDPKAKPSRWKFTMERLGLVLGNIVIRDEAMSPHVNWNIQGLNIEAGGLTTRAGQPAGHLALQSKVGESPFELSSDEIRLAPGAVSLGISVKDFDLSRVLPYVPPAIPAGPYGGRLSFNIRIAFERGAEGVTRAVVTGDINLADLKLIRRGGPAPFMTVPRLSLKLKEADLLSRVVVVSNVDIEGVQVEALRDKSGVIDLLKLAEAPPAATVPSPATQPKTTGAAASAAAKGQAPAGVKFLLERLALSKGTATFVDEAASPRTTLAVTDFGLTLESFAWPVVGPAKLAVGAGLPGGGRIEVRGSLVPQPLDASFTMTVRDAPVEPYQAYFPFPARLSGRYFGDSQNRIIIKDGRLTALSKGNSWAQGVEVRAPGAADPAVRVERMELVGLDFAWPTRAAVARVGFQRPAVLIERSQDGVMNLRALFTPPPTPGEAPPAAPPAPAPAAESAKKKGLLETMALDFAEIRVENGAIRFLDRTTKPAFSEDVSRLEISVAGLSNKRGQLAKLTLQSVIGGDSALDLRGEIGPLGAPRFVDLTGELRSFPLPTVNPYAEQAIAWVIRRGDLKYNVKFRLDDDQVTATNEVVIGHLQVAKSPDRGDEVKQRIGLPLGLIVALIKDTHGEIRVSVPVSGSLKDPKFELSEAIWTAVRNVLVNVLAAPFRLIGGLFTSSDDKVDDLKVEPVTFAAGSAAIAPAMEEHLLRVADFLRRTPFVDLGMRPVASATDLEALKAQEVAARLQRFQREAGAADLAAALRLYYQQRVPDATIPKTVDEQVALLRQREPVPAGPLAELLRRRLEATRDRLTKAEGIPAERLVAAAPPAAAAASTDGAGRVEFDIREREE
ncbi:MAG TPA: DUF748 domain-containing protein [Methylomirabilota bacterium]|nr:DUF748 domain-containing protein [Methylomirabilota bacterium]